jgi:predicted flap endonuclease-1-like 5' DNA nuclease
LTLIGFGYFSSIIMTKFLCDWGSSDSNMLLFFLLSSFLLGLLAGWLMWRKKMEELAASLAQRDKDVLAFKAELAQKENEIQQYQTDLSNIRTRAKGLHEEKGQIYASLQACNEENARLTGVNQQYSLELGQLNASNTDLNLRLNDAMSQAAAKVVAPIAIETVPPNNNITAEVPLEIATPSNPIAMAVAEDSLRRDDLQLIEGINPHIEGLMNDASVFTFKQLADAPESQIEAILEAGGPAFAMHTASSWQTQARMAYNEQWSELRAYQESLKAGQQAAEEEIVEEAVASVSTEIPEVIETPIVEPEAILMEVEPEVAAETPTDNDMTMMAAATGQKDDLKIIEGIGPKIEELLNNAGILTFRQLADASVEEVQAILNAAGPRFRVHNPATWGQQSELAYAWKWDELKALQDKLNGGRV